MLKVYFFVLQKELPQKTDCPHMCAYKLVTVKFKWFGLQNKVEGFIQKVLNYKRMEWLYADFTHYLYDLDANIS